MRQLFLLLLSFIVITLSGCATQKYSYTPPDTATGKSCIARCMVGKNSCEQLCLLKNPSCWIRAKQQAQIAFDLYKQQQRAKGQRIRKRLKDFKQDNDCKHACNCTPAYNTCYTACGGEVY